MDLSSFARSRPVDSETVSYLTRQIQEARAIYETLFPTQHLHFILRLGNDPVWSHPEVTEGTHVPRASDLGADFLGCVERFGIRDDSPEVTIRLSIPRPPLPHEIRQTATPWQPPARLGFLFRTSPMAYEQVRYQAEMLRKRRADRRKDKVALPLGEGSALIPRLEAPASDQRPAILIGMHWLEVGGAEKLGFDTVRWALAAGLRVFVVASVPAIQRLAQQLPDHSDVTFIRLDRYLPHHLWPRYVEKLARAQNIRAVHIHHCTPLYEALPMLRARLPWIRTIDSTHIIEYANGGYPRISGVWTNYLDVQHVISRQLADYVRGSFQAPASRVRLGRMLDRAKIADRPLVLRMQSRQTSLHVSFIGRLFYQKRPVVVVEILCALDVWAQKNGVALMASMVGEGPYEATIRRLLARHGLADKVIQLPGDTDIPALLDRSDILLLPSNNEGLALVCYEAIGHGCIPISTRVGAHGELLPPDLLVSLTPRATVQETVAVIDRMWRDEEFLVRQKTGLEAAWTQLSTDPTAEEVLMPIYREIADQGRKG
ncbi:glycosyltransferase [Paracoccus actinidiae]|uniref:glycosyltransferase n=1 Tax=Paracoccus actinidiae TaxID=3064531 RepID=UPI0027D25E8F|nr:glycosyltransferase [Paracoccus sp. M09]